MGLVITEEQQMLKDSAHELLRVKSPVNKLRKLRDDGYTPYDKSLWQEMVQMGWTSLIVPEEYNGLNFGYVGLGQILEETGKTLAKSPLISSTLLSTSALNLCDNETLKSKTLPMLMNGSKTMSFAIEENTYHKPFEFKTTAKLSGENYIVNGNKTFVIDGSTSDYFIIVAEINPNKIGFFKVDSNSQGISMEKNILLDTGIYSDINLEQVKVPVQNQLNINIDGKTLLDELLVIAYSGLSAEMLGIIHESFNSTIKYLKEREQFGVVIGTYQALQHRAAKMFVEIELCKSIVMKSLQAIDENDKNRFKYAHLAKAKLGKTIKLVTNEAIQMHGGIGVTDDADIGFYMKRARVLQQLFGDYNYHLDRLASNSGY